MGRCPPGCTEHEILPVTDIAGGRAVPRSIHERDRQLNQHPWRLRQVPVAAVVNPNAQLVIAAGSEIDPEVLDDEVTQLDNAGYHVSARLLTDRSATIIEQRHKDQESNDYGEALVGRIGSTGKGIGAARAARCLRKARLAGEVLTGAGVVPTGKVIRSFMESHYGTVLVEGTQGYRLGTHAGDYPQCTTSDCTAVDMLSMAGISPWAVRRSELRIWVVARTYPIRVAGNSGPLPGETTWEELGLQPELTTVTQKIRRVGRWDPTVVRTALRANGATFDRRSGPVRLALNMVDYLIPELAGLRSASKLPEAVDKRLFELLADTHSQVDVPVTLVGTGPDSIIDLRDGE
jgi:adenylosuccinate synthase